jgi:hypothetical protein
LAGNAATGLPSTATSIELQELVGSGQLPSNPIEITGISFRAAPGTGRINATIGSLSVYLSTSPNFPNTNGSGKTLMSSTFANNVGPDKTLVYSGSNIVARDTGCTAPGPCPSDINITFTTPFFYGAAGPLLIDLFETNLSGTSGALDAQSFPAPGGSVAQVVGPLGSSAGTFSYQGSIVQLTYFTKVPTNVSQVAAGGAWGTELVATNTTDGPVSFGLNCYLDTGGGATQPWNIAFVETSSTQNLLLPPAGTLFLHTPPASVLTTGWCQVVGDPGLALYAIFTQIVAGRPNQDGTAPASASATGVIVPFNNTSGFVTSVGLVNPNPEAIVVGSYIQTDTGAVLQPPLFTMPPFGHLAFALPTQFSTTGGQRGLIQFYASSGSVSALALLFDPSGSFTAAPTYPTTAIF